MTLRKYRFTAKQDRQAAHIAKSEEARGKSPQEAKRIGFATLNAREGGSRSRRRSSRK